MELTAAQLAQYERDGFLIFPDLFGQAEVAVLRQEVARLAKINADEVVREHTGGVKSLFRVHEEDGPTRSAPFRVRLAGRATGASGSRHKLGAKAYFRLRDRMHRTKSLTAAVS